MFDTPILYIIFNRLDTVKRTFPKIQEIQPKELYIASDGPRVQKPGEDELCKQVKDFVLENINWKCNVHTLFRKENLGCGKNVSKAITWFFENVEQGIILEDDCLPDMSFFPYCEELLNKYKDNPKVMHITGDNPMQKTKTHHNESYYFEKIQHCWGWANWARSWKHYNFDIDDNYINVLNTNNYFKHPRIKKQWTDILNLMRDHKIDTWDYQWSYKILEMDGLCINPKVNLIQNIGMNSGIHYENSKFSSSDGRPSFTLSFPLKHPKKLDFDYRAIKKLQGTDITLKKIIRFILKYILKKLGLFDFVKNMIKQKK